MDGSRSGTGKCSFSTGDLYEGDWLADVPHGDGRLDVLLGNLKYEGVFAEGRPSQVPSKMNVTFPSEATAPAGGAKKGGKGPATDEAPTMPVSARAVGGGGASKKGGRAPAIDEESTMPVSASNRASRILTILSHHVPHQVTLGIPLAFPVTLSAQFERALDAAEVALLTPPPPTGKGAAAAPPPPAGPVISEPPCPGGWPLLLGLPFPPN